MARFECRGKQTSASPEIQRRLLDFWEQSAVVLSSKSTKPAPVREGISAVAPAGQISREFDVRDQGVDMEIEFKIDANEATGQMLTRQLRSGDSYQHERKSDGAEICKPLLVHHPLKPATERSNGMDGNAQEELKDVCICQRRRSVFAGDLEHCHEVMPPFRPQA